MGSGGKKNLRYRDAADERQYMLSGDYEVYEKVGEPIGAVTFHYHDFYELIYIMEGEFSSLIEDRAVRMRKGDFLLIDKNVMHKYHPTGKSMASSRRIILWISDQMLRNWRKENRFWRNVSGVRDRSCIIFPFIMRKFCVDFC